MGEPHILGAAAVIPLPKPDLTGFENLSGLEPHIKEKPEPEETYQVKPTGNGAGMRRDEEIEAVGMQVAIQYERDRGWQPEDASGENHGFDVRSTCYNEDGSYADTRYIEVKARAQSGAIRLSSNDMEEGSSLWGEVLALHCDNGRNR